MPPQTSSPSVPPVTGPSDASTGFIHDFVRVATIYADRRMIAGDVIKFTHVSCEGYSIDPCTLLPPRPGDPIAEYDDVDNNSIDFNIPLYESPCRTNITFRPSSIDIHSEAQNIANADDSATQRSSDAGNGQNIQGWTPDPPQVSTTVMYPEKLTIQGISDEDNENTIQITFSSDDPHASSISRDLASGSFTLDVLLVDSGFDVPMEDYKGFYMDLSDGPDCPIIKVSSSFFSSIWETYEAVVDDPPKIEGVCVVDNGVTAPLAELIDRQISELASKEPVDWHPGSNDCVRDLVHPSMYCFVKGKSSLSPVGEEILGRIETYNQAVSDGNEVADCSLEAINGPLKGLDRWGRLFEESKFQWLPSVFHVAENGRVTIRGYINNLDRLKYEGLYGSIARLFEAFVPMFEAVYDYLPRARPLPFHEDEMLESRNQPNTETSPQSLYGTDVRVITKIVDYELRAKDDNVDGVFHVEGMSTDHILMTGIYIVSRDDDFLGGDLIFRRTFLDFEGAELYETFPQCRHWKAEKIVEDGVRPIGTLRTPQGRMIVFPNSHIHKLSLMTRAFSDLTPDAPRPAVSRRRVVVFWLIDPERDVLTTQEVPRQQSVMSYETACLHRLELMEERKKRKGKLNGERQISLCEH